MDLNKKIGKQGKIQRGIHQRRDDLNRIADHSVKIFRVSGRIQVIGEGECSASVTFPVTFAERPAFSFGYELAANQTPIAGTFPIVSAGVATWERTEKIRGLYHYTGAVITMVADGNPHYCFVHWHMEGRAFQNPVDNLGSPEALSQ